MCTKKDLAQARANYDEAKGVADRAHQRYNDTFARLRRLEAEAAKVREDLLKDKAEVLVADHHFSSRERDLMEAHTADPADDLRACRCGLKLVRKAFQSPRQKVAGCPSCLCPIPSEV